MAQSGWAGASGGSVLFSQPAAQPASSVSIRLSRPRQHEPGASQQPCGANCDLNARQTARLLARPRRAAVRLHDSHSPGTTTLRARAARNACCTQRESRRLHGVVFVPALGCSHTHLWVRLELTDGVPVSVWGPGRVSGDDVTLAGQAMDGCAAPVDSVAALQAIHAPVPCSLPDHEYSSYSPPSSWLQAACSDLMSSCMLGNHE